MVSWWPEAFCIASASRVKCGKSRVSLILYLNTQQKNLKNAFGAHITACYFMCLLTQIVSRALQAGWGNSYCSNKWFSVLGWLATAHQPHTYLPSWCISLISLSGRAVTLSGLGQTWSTLPAQIPGNGNCLVLSGLALNKSPQDNHTTIINQHYSFSLSLSLLLRFFLFRSASLLSLSLSVDISTGGFLILVLSPPLHHVPLVRLNTLLRYSVST